MDEVYLPHSTTVNALKTQEGGDYPKSTLRWSGSQKVSQRSLTAQTSRRRQQTLPEQPYGQGGLTRLSFSLEKETEGGRKRAKERRGRRGKRALNAARALSLLGKIGERTGSEIWQRSRERREKAAHPGSTEQSYLLRSISFEGLRHRKWSIFSHNEEEEPSQSFLSLSLEI